MLIIDLWVLFVLGVVVSCLGTDLLCWFKFAILVCCFYVCLVFCVVLLAYLIGRLFLYFGACVCLGICAVGVFHQLLCTLVLYLVWLFLCC